MMVAAARPPQMGGGIEPRRIGRHGTAIERRLARKLRPPPRDKVRSGSRASGLLLGTRSRFAPKDPDSLLLAQSEVR